MTIYERALEFIKPGMIVGLGSGRASAQFIALLGERFNKDLKIKGGVPTSNASDEQARKLGIPILDLADAIAAGGIDVCIDGADECDPNLDMVKGWGRALIREKVVETASKKFIVIFNHTEKEPKLVDKLGTRGKLPVEVAPFAKPLCEKMLKDLGLRPRLWSDAQGNPLKTDNQCYILDCGLDPIADAHALEAKIEAIPGVLGTGLFLGMADVVVVGDENFKVAKELTRKR